MLIFEIFERKKKTRLNFIMHSLHSKHSIVACLLNIRPKSSCMINIKIVYRRYEAPARVSNIFQILYIPLTYKKKYKWNNSYSRNEKCTQFMRNIWMNAIWNVNISFWFAFKTIFGHIAENTIKIKFNSSGTYLAFNLKWKIVVAAYRPINLLCE